MRFIRIWAFILFHKIQKQINGTKNTGYSYWLGLYSFFNRVVASHQKRLLCRISSCIFNKKFTSVLHPTLLPFFTVFFPTGCLSSFWRCYSLYQVVSAKEGVSEDRFRLSSGLPFQSWWFFLTESLAVSIKKQFYKRTCGWFSFYCQSKNKIISKKIASWWLVYQFDISRNSLYTFFWASFCRFLSLYSKKSFFNSMLSCLSLFKNYIRSSFMSVAVQSFQTDLHSKMAVSEKEWPRLPSRSCSNTTDYRPYLFFCMSLYDITSKEIKQERRFYKLISLGNRGQLCSLYSLNYWHNFVCFRVYKAFSWFFKKKYSKHGQDTASSLLLENRFIRKNPSEVLTLWKALYGYTFAWSSSFYKSIWFFSGSICAQICSESDNIRRWSLFLKSVLVNLDFFFKYLASSFLNWGTRLRRIYSSFFIRQMLFWRVRNLFSGTFSAFFDSFYSSDHFQSAWFKLKAKRFFRRRRWFHHYENYYSYKKNVEQVSRKHSGFKKIPFAMRQKWRWKGH